METAAAVPGVKGVHQVIVEHVGPEVRADCTSIWMGRCHWCRCSQVSDAVRSAIERIEGVEHAFIDVEPLESDERLGESRPR